MAQIIQREPSVGQLAGQGFASSLSSMLQNLATQKAQQLQSRQVQNALMNAGVSPEYAQLFGVLPPEIQKNFISNLDFAIGGAEQRPQLQEPQTQPQQAFNELVQQQISPGQPSTEQLMQMLQPQNIARDSSIANLSQMLGVKPQDIPFASQQMQMDRFQPLTTQQQPQEIQIKPLTPKQREEQNKNENRFGAEQGQPLTAKLFESPEAKLRRETLQLKQRQLSQRERAEAFKMTKEERKEIQQKSKAAKENLKDLERLEELQREGKLDTPGYVEFLERSGLDIPALLNEGSQEFNKITQNFLRDAKAYFGARVSNFEIEQFMKTIPNLSQSPEGRKRVIANLKRLQRGAVEYGKTMREIIAENNGTPPLDLSDQIEERVDPKLDRIYDQFKLDLKKPSPPAQNRLVTALQASLGSVIGAPSNIAKTLLGAGAKALI